MKDITTISIKLKMILYIPHGSDESLQFLRRRNIKYVLYIPHGSDERHCIVTLQVHSHRTLYPTWFRWKRHRKPLVVQGIKTLYPTWFRWKVNPLIFNVVGAKALYPTWFRWKPSPAASYEPQPLFISHMVQMKGSHFLSPWFVIRSLYPTWFRWKLISLLKLLIWQNFISHMVQMKDIINLIYN